jgi:hypothetical protein
MPADDGTGDEVNGPVKAVAAREVGVGGLVEAV